MTPLALALLAALAAAPEEGAAPAPSPARVRTVAGKLGEVRLAEGTAQLQLGEGAIRLLLDRNTAVFLPGKAGTLADLAAGEPARASVDASGRAFWIELHPRGVIPTREPRAPPAASPPPASPAPAVAD